MQEYISVDYKDLRGNLSVYSAVVLFRKKNGKKRVMICTRDTDTIRKLTGTSKEGLICGYDKRHNIDTNTLGVVDLAIMDARTVPVDRILGIVYVGRLTDDINCEIAFQYYNRVVQSVEAEDRAEQAALQQEVQNMYNS